MEVDEAGFERLAANTEIPLVVDFWASWCGPCKMMAPQFEQAARQWRGQVSFAKLNTEEAPRAAGQFGIRSIPTLILFRGGREVARSSGAQSAAQLSAWLQQQLR